MLRGSQLWAVFWQRFGPLLYLGTILPWIRAIDGIHRHKFSIPQKPLFGLRTGCEFWAGVSIVDRRPFFCQFSTNNLGMASKLNQTKLVHLD